MKKSIQVLLIFVLVLIGFTVVFALFEVRFFQSRASAVSGSFSSENSYVFATPLSARANGQEKIRLTIFILDSRGLGVMGKKVSLSPNSSLNIEAIQGLTDGYGKAYFDVTAVNAGQYYLEVMADGTAIKQKAKLSYE